MARVLGSQLARVLGKWLEWQKVTRLAQRMEHRLEEQWELQKEQ